MALSDYERKMLEQLEAQLKGEDPKFADTLAPGDTRLTVSPRHLVFGLIIAVLGIMALAGGVALENVFVGIGGAVIIWLGFMYLSSGMSRVAASPVPRTGKPKPSTSDFLAKQQQEFNKRREEGGR